MVYAQFYCLSTGYVQGSIPPRYDDAHKEPIPACGDRAVVIIDGRLSDMIIGKIARDECIKRGYIGYRIFKGKSFTRSVAVSGYWPVPSSKADLTASSASYGE